MVVIDAPDIDDPINRNKNRGESQFKEDIPAAHELKCHPYLVGERECDDAEEERPDRAVSNNLD